MSYQKDGVQIMSGILPRELERIRHHCELAVERAGVRRDREVGGKPGEHGRLRRFNDEVVDGHGVLEHARALFEWYGRLREIAQQVTGRVVTFSPWLQSCITIKSYRAPKAEHGWHVDSNSVSALMYLTAGAPLEFYPPGVEPSPTLVREPQRITPEPGMILILRGRDVWHRVPPSDNPNGRLTVVMNYYHPGEVERPAGLDSLHYGETKTPELVVNPGPYDRP